MVSVLGACMLSAIALGAPAEAPMEQWSARVATFYRQPGPARDRHPKSQAAEIRVPFDSPHGLGACTFYFQGGEGVKGRIRVEFVLLRPQEDGSLVSVASVDVKSKIRPRQRVDLCEIVPGSALAGDIVRFNYTFKRMTRLKFPLGSASLQSSIEPLTDG